MLHTYFDLESFSKLTFHELQSRLLSFVKTSIRNGEFTERRLARILGVSQPHLHNVLKGARPLKPAFADTLLRQFEIGVLHLLKRAELSAHLEATESQLPLFWAETLEGPDPAPHAKIGLGKSSACVRRLAS